MRGTQGEHAKTERGKGFRGTRSLMGPGAKPPTLQAPSSRQAQARRRAVPLPPPLPPHSPFPLPPCPFPLLTPVHLHPKRIRPVPPRHVPFLLPLVHTLQVMYMRGMRVGKGGVRRHPGKVCHVRGGADRFWSVTATPAAAKAQRCCSHSTARVGSRWRGGKWQGGKGGCWEMHHTHAHTPPPPHPPPPTPAHLDHSVGAQRALDRVAQHHDQLGLHAPWEGVS